MNSIDLIILAVSWGLAFAAIYFLLSSVDNLFIETLCLAWRFYFRRIFMSHHHRLYEESLSIETEQPIAVMIPLWKESAVIGEMVNYFIRNIDYKNYVIFVGLYPNDKETATVLSELVNRYPGKVSIAHVDHAGPTTKDDCLNSIVNSVFEYEKNHNVKFQIFVIDDAEDAAPRDGLRVFNHLIPGKDLVQLPVYPAPSKWYQLTAGHYMDEFAEMHLKELRVREWLTGAVPSAGVGVGISRRAIESSLMINLGSTFPTNTLTSDYEFPMLLSQKGFSSVFFDVDVDPDREHRTASSFYSHHRTSPAVRSLFPETAKGAIIQKSRWIIGIALQGWAHLRWRGSLFNRYFLFRDRKALAGHFMTIFGYCLVFAISALSLVEYFDASERKIIAEIVPYQSNLWYLLLINFWLMLIQIFFRMLTTFELYGLVHALMSLPRLVWANLINFLATVRALYLFVHYKRLGTDIVPWDKTRGHHLP